MNRRNMIKGTLGATTVTLVPGAVVAGSLSRDLSNSSELNAEKWELAFRLSKMPGECGPISVGIVGLGLTKDHKYRESLVAAFDAGESFDEAYARIVASA